MKEKYFQSSVPIGIFLLSLFLLFNPLTAYAADAPFGNEVSPAITYYNRASPQIATAGSFDTTAIPEIIEHGFKTVIELRTLEEKGVRENADALTASKINFFHIPVSTRAPTDAQVSTFADLLSNPDNYPILVNCQTANRVGAMWALYRARNSVAEEVAIEEGRTAGLTSRETAVRKRLGLLQ